MLNGRGYDGYGRCMPNPLECEGIPPYTAEGSGPQGEDVPILLTGKKHCSYKLCTNHLLILFETADELNPPREKTVGFTMNITVSKL